MPLTPQSHLVVVEAYEGSVEYLSDEPAELRTLRGLGLPIAELAEQLGCRITVLTWEQWRSYEVQHLDLPIPATQPAHSPLTTSLSQTRTADHSTQVQWTPITARDPFSGLPIEERGLSPRSHGLINDSGFLFFASFCLLYELRSLHQSDPIQAVIVPDWGGLGYVAQMARATHAPNQLNVPFAVVVSDASIERQVANQEGVWTRQAMIRRQMEDLSLALADLALVFGSRGKERAIASRLPESAPPVQVPRWVEDSLLNAIEVASQPTPVQSVQCFLYEPQQSSSGVLVALDAVAELTHQGVRLESPFISAGPPMTFAPMKPRDFVSYWSSRGFVKELVRDRQWHWQREYPEQRPDQEGYLPIRLYPSVFEYLPNIWDELARGSLVLLSAAAAEGLAPGECLPDEVHIGGEPTPKTVAHCLKKLIETDPQQLDQIRQTLCQQVVKAHRGDNRSRLLHSATTALAQLLSAPSAPQDLSRVALLLSDRRFPLRVLAQHHTPAPLPQRAKQLTSPSEPTTPLPAETLSVVITCYEMGELLKEALMSVWTSERMPDEVLLVNDGSSGAATLTTIQELEQIATQNGWPLRVIHQPNQGLASARNTGLGAATGDLISFLDGDDVIEPAFYPVAEALLKQYPRLGGVAAWAAIFGGTVPDGDWCAPQPELPALLVENSVIVPCVTRTALLHHLGGYDVRQRYNYEDWELSIRMLASGWAIVTVPMHLMRYRIRQDSLYRTMTEIQNQVMREQLMTTHREVVTQFAVELAMQLEHQWKQSNAHLADTDSASPDWLEQIIPFGAALLSRIRRGFLGLPGVNRVCSLSNLVHRPHLSHFPNRKNPFLVLTRIVDRTQ